MTERTPVDPFEERLVRLIRTYTQPAAKPADPLATARTAMTARADGRAASARSWWPRHDLRLLALVVTAGLLILLTLLAIAAGALVTPRTGPLATAGQLVFVRDGDLFTSLGDGSGVTRIREGDAGGSALGYLAAIWSPDLRHIAAVRDIGGPGFTPVVEIMAVDGTHDQRVELEPGGMPSLSWSPDGTRLAVGSYPATVARDAFVPVLSSIRLRVVGTDGDVRKIDLPSEARSLAGAAAELWTAPSLGIRWSPDGRWIAMAWIVGNGVAQWHLVTPDGSTIRDLSALTQPQCGIADRLDWLPDGRRVATIGHASGTQVFCVQEVMSGGSAGTAPEPTPIAELKNADQGLVLTLPVVSPESDRLAVATFTSDFAQGRYLTTLRVYDLASGEWHDVAAGVQALVLAAGDPEGKPLGGTPVWEGGVAWSPDGQRLLYLSPESGDGPRRWTLRAVDAGGDGAPAVILEHVGSFDSARRP